MSSNVVLNRPGGKTDTRETSYGILHQVVCGNSKPRARGRCMHHLRDFFVQRHARGYVVDWLGNGQRQIAKWCIRWHGRRIIRSRRRLTGRWRLCEGQSCSKARKNNSKQGLPHCISFEGRSRLALPLSASVTRERKLHFNLLAQSPIKCHTEHISTSAIIESEFYHLRSGVRANV